MGVEVMLFWTITSKERSEAAREMRSAMRIRAVMSENIGSGCGKENCGEAPARRRVEKLLAPMFAPILATAWKTSCLRELRHVY